MVAQNRRKHNIPVGTSSKFVNTTFYNKITSFNDIERILYETYDKKNNAFKIHISFGYLVETNIITHDEIEARLIQPSNVYLFNKMYVINSRQTMTNFIDRIKRLDLSHELTKEYSSRTKLLGIYAMSVKIIDLSYLMGAPIKMPDYMKINNNIICAADVENNMCFFACCAFMLKARRDRYKNKATELFVSFYGAYNNNYRGFDYVNELDAFEQSFPHAINIIQYREDKSIVYVRRSPYNDRRENKHIIMFENHFAYVSNITRLAGLHICNNCGAKFRNNFDCNMHYKNGSCNNDQ